MSSDGSAAPLPERRPTAPPPRPPVTRSLPPPTRPSAGPAPRVLRVAAGLVGAAWVAAVVGGLAAIADLPGSRARLAADAAAQDPEATGDLLRESVTVTLVTALSAIGVLVVVGGTCLALLLRRQSWARWGVALVALAAVPVTLVVASVVAGGPDVDRWALLAVGPLALAGTLLLPARSIGAWLRGPVRATRR